MSEPNAASSAAPNGTNGKEIQKKLLNYARDFALEKISKTIDKKLSKQRGDVDDNDDDDNNGGDAFERGAHRNQISNDHGRHRRRSGASRRSFQPAVSHHRQTHPDVDEELSADEHRRRSRYRQSQPQPLLHISSSQSRGIRQHKQQYHLHNQRLHNHHNGMSSDGSRKGRRKRSAIAVKDSSEVEDDEYDDEFADDVTTELVRVSASINNSGSRRLNAGYPQTQSVPLTPQSSFRSNGYQSVASGRHQRRSSRPAPHRPVASSAGSGAADAKTTVPSRKYSMAPLPPPTYAPLPRRRSCQPAFPVSNAHLMQATTNKRSVRARKSIYTDDNDDDEFHTATDDDDDDDDDDESEGDGSTLSDNSDSASLSFSDSDKTLMMRRPISKENGVQRKSSGRSSSERKTHSFNNHNPVELRPKPMGRMQKPAYLAIDIPEYSTRSSRSNARTANDSADDNLTGPKLVDKMPVRTPVGSPGINGQGTTTADYSGYIQKKSLAQGMMDLALLSANINQMRYLLEYKDNQPYFATSFTLVVTSLLLQIGVSLTLIWNIRFNVKKSNEMKEADRVNNIGVMGIFLVTVINVALSTFGGAPAPKEIQVGGSAVTAGILPDMTDNGGSGDAPIFAAEPLIYT